MQLDSLAKAAGSVGQGGARRAAGARRTAKQLMSRAAQGDVARQKRLTLAAHQGVLLAQLLKPSCTAGYTRGARPKSSLPTSVMPCGGGGVFSSSGVFRSGGFSSGGVFSSGGFGSGGVFSSGGFGSGGFNGGGDAISGVQGSHARSLRQRTCSRTAAHIQRGPQRLLVAAKNSHISSIVTLGSSGA